MIFLVITVISFLMGVLRSFPILLFDLSNIQNIIFYSPIFSVINILINPFLIFIIFYKIGIKFDLKSNLMSLIVKLLLGAYLGYFISSNLVFLIIRGVDSYFSILIGNIFSTTFLGMFFVAFSGLAIAYLRHNN